MITGARGPELVSGSVQWSPESLAAAAGGTLVRRSERAIAGAFIDSRTPVDGALFVPLVAARDGHEFIAAALAGGASAVLVGRPQIHALAVGGAAGVAHMLTILRAELEVAMALTGRCDLAGIDETVLWPSP